MKHTVSTFDLNRPSAKTQTESGLGLCDTSEVKKRLLQELVELEKQRDELESQTDFVDFSMMQTYQEMIHSRRVQMNQLNS